MLTTRQPFRASSRTRRPHRASATTVNVDGAVAPVEEVDPADGTRGSEVIRGNLLVIPIEESLIYVQPLYLRAEGGRIPELKRVVVAYQNRVVMEETLEQGLSRLFGGAGAPAQVAAASGAAARPADGAALDLARRAGESFRRAVEAQRAGDWARYGEELSRLEEVLRQLQVVLGGGGGRRQ